MRPMQADNYNSLRSNLRRGRGPRWLLSHVPQYAELPDEIRGRIYNRCKNKAFLHWQVLLPACGFLLLGSIATYVSVFRLHVPYVAAVAIGVWGFGGLLIPGILKRRFFILHLREEIGRICLVCGYDLRAANACCPECGSPNLGHHSPSQPKVTPPKNA
jgi:hypothetical protein